MFDNEFFEKWIDEQATQVLEKLAKQQSLSQNEMMVLVLKAQTNHIHHISQNMHGEMVSVRKDVAEIRQEVTEVRQEVTEVKQEIKEVKQDVMTLREDMDRRFELMQQQMDKRFELMQQQMDKRFEQVQQQLNNMINRSDNMMRWSISTTLVVGGLVVAAIKLLN